MARKHKGKIYFEVRIAGDGEYEYFVEPAEEGGAFNYDPNNFQSCIKHAKEVSGWVVRVTEEVAWE